MILKGFQDRFRTGLRLLKKISNYFSGCFCNILPAGRFEIVQNLYFFLYLWNHQQNSITFICDEMEANWIVNWCITWSVWNWINPLSNRIRLNLSTAEPTDQSFELYFSFLFLFLFLSFSFFFFILEIRLPSLQLDAALVRVRKFYGNWITQTINQSMVCEIHRPVLETRRNGIKIGLNWKLIVVSDDAVSLATVIDPEIRAIGIRADAEASLVPTRFEGEICRWNSWPVAVVFMGDRRRRVWCLLVPSTGRMYR